MVRATDTYFENDVLLLLFREGSSGGVHTGVDVGGWHQELRGGEGRGGEGRGGEGRGGEGRGGEERELNWGIEVGNK